MSPGWQVGICGTAAVWFRQSVDGRANRSAGVPIGRRASQVAPLRLLGGGLSIVGATFMSPGWQAGICRTAAVWFRQSLAGVSNRWRAYQTVYGRHKWRPYVSRVAVWFRQSVGGRHKWRPYVSRVAVWFRQSVGGRHKWRPYVSRAAVWFRPIGWRASQVAFLRFPGGGLSIVGATFMSPGWQAGICGTAAVWFRQSLAGVPIGRRACQSVCGGGKPLAGVTSGAPTFPRRRFVNRRGDIHVARMAGGNMRDRGGLVRQSLAGVSNRWRACQTVYGRHKWRPCVSRAAVWFRPIGWRASQVAPLRLPGGGLVPPNRLTGVTSGAPTFPGRQFGSANRRRAYQTVGGRHKWRPYVSRSAVCQS